MGRPKERGSVSSSFVCEEWELGWVRRSTLKVQLLIDELRRGGRLR